MATVTSELSGMLGILQIATITEVITVTMVTDVVWGFPIQPHVGLHAKYPLPFSDFNQDRGVSTDFNETLQYQIL